MKIVARCARYLHESRTLDRVAFCSDDDVYAKKNAKESERQRRGEGEEGKRKGGTKVRAREKGKKRTRRTDR